MSSLSMADQLASHPLAETTNSSDDNSDGESLASILETAIVAAPKPKPKPKPKEILKAKPKEILAAKAATPARAKAATPAKAAPPAAAPVKKKVNSMTAAILAQTGRRNEPGEKRLFSRLQGVRFELPSRGGKLVEKNGSSHIRVSIPFVGKDEPFILQIKGNISSIDVERKTVIEGSLELFKVSGRKGRAFGKFYIPEEPVVPAHELTQHPSRKTVQRPVGWLSSLRIGDGCLMLRRLAAPAESA